MERPIALALVGEYTPSFVPHAKTDAAFDQMRSALGIEIDATWISAANLDDEPQSKLSRFHGIWVAPGSPYKSMQGALNAIRHSREHGIPLLGTCGGCQHVVIEYARNVLGFYDAQHAEYDPYASNLFVTPLSCSLVGQRMEVHIEAGSRVAAIYAPRECRKNTTATLASIRSTSKSCTKVDFISSAAMRTVRPVSLRFRNTPFSLRRCS